MGRVRGKGKKFTLTNTDDLGSGEDERIPTQKRRGRPQKPLMDEVEKKEDEEDEEEEEEEHSENVKKKKKDDLAKEESRSNGFRHNGSRRKNKPHRAAEAGVECR